jgi:formylglycine-generating enzyme required for sulfatase activity
MAAVIQPLERNPAMRVVLCLRSFACAFMVVSTLGGCNSASKPAAIESEPTSAANRPEPIVAAPAHAAEDNVHTQTHPSKTSPPVPKVAVASTAESVAVPAGTVAIDGKSIAVAAFAIGRTEVTTEAYARCVAEKKCSPAASDDIACNWPKRKAKGKHPINCVTVEQAEAYCEYESERLPTVAEWQLAAGGPEKRHYPWGSTHPSNIQVTEPPAGGAYGPGAARHYLCWSGDGTDREKYPTWTCPVGSFPAGNTPSGISDLAGNVAEWTSTTVKLPHGPVHHVIKGGGYNFDGLGRLEVAVEDSETHGSGHKAPDVGFRCVTGTKAEAQP